MMRWLGIAMTLCLTGCASSSEQAKEAVQNAGWQWNILHAGAFDLAVAESPLRPSDTLWIYIEGDGFAYVSPTRPSSDPTPRHPVALHLALQHPENVTVAYLARPCQYGAQKPCAQQYWTGARYAPEVVESTDSAVTQLKTKTGASKVVLAGYSGGGTLAVLVAAQRDDVSKIVTVAANPDLAYWTNKHHLAPLAKSLDPADAAAKVAHIPQLHFTGSADTVTGTDVVLSFMKKLPADAPARVIEIPGFTHYCCWEKNWNERIRAE